MKLRNVSPLGALWVQAVQRVVEPGEVFEVDDATGTALLDQPANFKAAPRSTPKEG